MNEDMKVREIRRFLKAKNTYMVLCESCTDIKQMFSTMKGAEYMITTCERGAIGLDPQQFGKWQNGKWLELQKHLTQYMTWM